MNQRLLHIDIIEICIVLYYSTLPCKIKIEERFILYFYMYMYCIMYMYKEVEKQVTRLYWFVHTHSHGHTQNFAVKIHSRLILANVCAKEWLAASSQPSKGFVFARRVRGRIKTDLMKYSHAVKEIRSCRIFPIRWSKCFPTWAIICLAKAERNSIWQSAQWSVNWQWAGQLCLLKVMRVNP